MSPGGWRCTRWTLLKVVLLAMAVGASAGCSSEDFNSPAWGPVREGPFDIVGEGMHDNFTRWRDSLNDSDRAVFDQLMEPKEPLLIHVFLATGRVPESRGGASAPTSDDRMKQICDIHPMIGDFEPMRNWDVAYDPEAAKAFEEAHGIPSPPETVLHHEIFGHVISSLGDPNIVFMIVPDARYLDTAECRALFVENLYREQRELPEVPPEWIDCLAPLKKELAP